MATRELTQPPEFDLFLSYNRQDQNEVLELRRKLELRGIHTFLDSDHLVAGLPWPQALERALLSSRAVAVFLGPHELGTWQKREMYLALDLQANAEREKRHFPVIPVLLRDAQPHPGFLFLNTWADFRTISGETEALEALKRAIQQDARSAVREASAICPYLGLRAFREQDQAFYFGRDAFIERLVEKLDGQQPIVAVVGPSGCGKTSVVMAGLLPRLRRMRSPAWDAISFTPGDNPWLRLAYALVPLLEPDLPEVTRIAKGGELATALAQRNGTLSATLVRALERTQGTSRLLVIVDQFEELFTLAPKIEDISNGTAKKDAEGQSQKRSEFLEDLLISPRSAPVTVLLTLRADYYGHALNASRALSDALNTGQIVLGPMLREELKQAIEGPAKMVGLQFESGLTSRMLDDVNGAPGSLPLLEYTLSQLWTERRNGVLTSGAYDAFGSVTGSIGDKAERIYNNFSATDKEAARVLFGRLVRVSPADMEGTDTRQRASRHEIGEAGWKVALQLAAAGIWLLVMSRDPQTNDEVVEVGHEALIRNWRTLRDWLQKDREFLLWRQQFQVFLSIWTRTAAKDETALLRGGALDEALKWRRSKGSDLTIREREFITRSEQKRKETDRLRLWVQRVAAVLVIAVVCAGLIWLYYTRTDRYQIDTILKHAPVREVSDSGTNASLVEQYLSVLATYRPEEAQRTAHQITDPDSRTTALNFIAQAQAKTGHVAEAVETWEEAQRTAHQITDPNSRTTSLNSIAQAQANSGQFAEAVKTWEEALRAAQQFTDGLWKTTVLHSIAQAQANSGQFAEAQRTAHQISDGLSKASALNSIAQAQADSRQLVEAVKTWEEAQRTAHQITDTNSRTIALDLIARAQANSGQLAEAVKTWEEALRAAPQFTDQLLHSIAQAQENSGQFAEAQRTAHQISHGLSKAKALNSIAQAQADSHQLAEAVKTWEEAQRAAHQITDPNSKSAAFDSIARAQANSGQLAKVVKIWEEALRAAHQISDGLSKASAVNSIAQAQASAGYVTEAVETWEEARRTAHQITDANSKATALNSIAQAQANSGQLAEAVKTWEEAQPTAEFRGPFYNSQFGTSRIAQQITDPNSNIRALNSIAQAQVKAGQFAEAQRMAQQIANTNLKATPFNSIAEAQAKTGHMAEAVKTWEEAQRTAQQITGPDLKAIALNSIAQAQASAGHVAEAVKTWEEAQRTAQQITDPNSKGTALHFIVRAQAKAGQWKVARITAGPLPLSGRLWAYTAILIEYEKTTSPKLRAILERPQQ